MMRTTSLSVIYVLLGLSIYGQSYALEYIPYAGYQGYQEIKITKDTYFVAFHGDKNTSGSDVKAAWSLRSAEICTKENMQFFIPLKYSFEPVLTSDPEIRDMLSRSPGSFYKVGGTFIYIPTYSSGPRYASENAPSAQSHIRCVADHSAARDQERLIEAQPVLVDGKSRGWLTN